MPPRARKKQWSPHKRTRVRKMYEMGYTARQIAACEGIPQNSVSGIATRYTHQQSGRDLPRPGQPPKLSDRDKRCILRCVRESPFIQNKQLLEQTGLGCSIETLTHYLTSQGIQHHRALQRPLLRPEDAFRRLVFAEKYARKPISWWRSVVFSDEVSIARGDGQRRQWVFSSRVQKVPCIETGDSFTNPLS